MKLYATTTSERAEKSQGGNEYINVEIRAGDKTREILGTLEVYIYDKNPTMVNIKWSGEKYLGAKTLHNEALPE